MNSQNRPILPTNECHLHEGRFFDDETKEWGYEVFCSLAEHDGRACGWEMFRIPTSERSDES